MLKLNYEFLPSELQEILKRAPSFRVSDAVTKFEIGLTAQEEPVGWFSWPQEDHTWLINEIKETASQIRAHSQVLVVIGIGGSYLGAKAILEALNPIFKDEADKTEIIFAGHHLSAEYLQGVKEYLAEKEFSLLVISKSGGTLEPALAFRYFSMLLQERYNRPEMKRRLYIITDPKKGVLHELAQEEEYTFFEVPQNIGGRYSVHTAVGLLPMAVAGINIEEFLQGAKRAKVGNTGLNYQTNQALSYALVRNHFYNLGKRVELFVFYEPKLRYFAEWLKQLYGESEGKDSKGLLPVSLQYTTDLHSLGQFVQEGSPIFFETIIKIVKDEVSLKITPGLAQDGLSYLEGKTFKYVEEQALLATAQAHVEGGVSNLVLEVGELNAFSLGYLTYFFMLSCAYSAFLLGVNPFNQPGVEAYKRNMFSRLKM